MAGNSQNFDSKMKKIFTFGSTFESCWINPSVSFTCKIFRIFKNSMFFFIILRVSRTFEHVLLDYWPYFNKLTESRFEVPWSPIFPDRLKICGRGRASFDQKKLSANRFADVRILGMCIINDHLCAGRNKLRKLPVKIFLFKNFQNFKILTLNPP